MFEGSDDELGMEDEMHDDSEPAFEALEITCEVNDIAKNLVAVKIAIQYYR